MTSAAARLQNVNIESNNYSRYGTSVYEKLYHNRNSSNNNAGKNVSTIAKLPSISQKSRNKNGSSCSRSATQSPISTFKSPLSNQNQASAPEDLVSTGQRRSDDIASLDNETIVTMNSRKSRIKKKYKSLISTSSKKLMNKLYDHGASSDSFSIFSLKTLILVSMKFQTRKAKEKKIPCFWQICRYQWFTDRISCWNTFRIRTGTWPKNAG